MMLMSSKRNCPDTLLEQRSLDPDAAFVHVQHVGIDAPLHDGSGQLDSLGGQGLHE